MASTDLSDVLGEAALQFVVGEDVIFVVKDQEKADNHDANDDDEGSLNFEMVEEFVLDDEEADFVHRKFSAKMCSSNEFWAINVIIYRPKRGKLNFIKMLCISRKYESLMVTLWKILMDCDTHQNHTASFYASDQ